MLKRTVDLVISGLVLFVLSPILSMIMAIVFLQDFHMPLYISPRVGRGGKRFLMVKLRTMVAGADRLGGSSSANTDRRITPLGRLLRKLKADELFQLINVLKGDISLVGPRPQVPGDVLLYTREERELLSVLPGITDISSIVFSDEGEILKEASDPDLFYQQYIRPWKSRLGLIYVRNRSAALDIRLIVLTVVLFYSRRTALGQVQRILIELGADGIVREVAKRQRRLIPFAPPGASNMASY